MRSFFVKGSLVLALAAAFGMSNASAAPLVAVEPTVAVVDGNHAAKIIQMQELRKSPLMRMEVKLSMM